METAAGSHHAREIDRDVIVRPWINKQDTHFKCHYEFMMSWQKWNNVCTVVANWLCALTIVFVRVQLTHSGRVTHMCVKKLGMSPGRCQAIIWINAVILFVALLGTNFSDISIGIQMFSFKKWHVKMLSSKWRPLCLGINVLNINNYGTPVGT